MECEKSTEAANEKLITVHLYKKPEEIDCNCSDSKHKVSRKILSLKQLF